jgi:integrase
VDLPHRPTADDSEEDEVKAMTREELSTLLASLPEKWSLFFWLLAVTGLRISEAVGLQWRHVELEGDSPHVKVRRGVVRGKLGPPKSRYARRDVPIDRALASALRERRRETEWPGGEDLVWPAANGQFLHVGNLRRRVLLPAREKANLEWIGFHAFRHTCATLPFAEGRNAVQAQSDGSVTTPRPSHWRRTSTCSTATSGRRLWAFGRREGAARAANTSRVTVIRALY